MRTTTLVRTTRQWPLTPAIALGALTVALAAFGYALLIQHPEPPASPSAARGDLDFQLQDAESRPATLDVFFRAVRSARAEILLVPHVRLEPGESVSWMLTATGAMRSATLARRRRDIGVERRPGATVFQGTVTESDDVDIVYDGDGREEVAYVGTPLVLSVPGPLVRFADGFAVMVLPGIGSSGLSLTTVVGRADKTALSVGDPDLRIRLSTTERLSGYKATAMTPPAKSIEPYGWEAAGRVKASVTATDLNYSDTTDRQNAFAGVLLGFALSLLLPLSSAVRGAFRALRRDT